MPELGQNSRCAFGNKGYLSPCCVAYVFRFAAPYTMVFAPGILTFLRLEVVYFETHHDNYTSVVSYRKSLLFYLFATVAARIHCTYNRNCTLLEGYNF